MKIHMFYFDDMLYAFTTVDEYADKFVDERAGIPFVHKIVKCSEHEFSTFCGINHSKMLMINYLDSKKGVASLITTESEDISLTDVVDRIISDRDDALIGLSKIPFKKKYRDILLEGLNMACGDDPQELNLDLVSIFVDINEEVFLAKNK